MATDSKHISTTEDMIKVKVVQSFVLLYYSRERVKREEKVSLHLGNTIPLETLYLPLFNHYS